MNSGKDILGAIFLYLVGTFFFLTVSVYALLFVLNKENIKKTTEEKGTYSQIVPSILRSAQANPNAGTLPLDEPWVKEVAEKAFPEADLQQKGNTVTDSLFDWLYGNTDKPDFTLDFTENKQRLGDEVAGYTESRLQSLPPCSLDNIPQTLDPFRLECRPPGVDVSEVSSRVREQIASDTNFLPNPVISSEDLFEPIQSELQGTADGLGRVQGVFQNKDTLLWALPGITLMLAVLGFYLMSDKRRALTRLGGSFISGAVGLIIIGLIFGVGLGRVLNSAAKDPLTQSVFSPLISELGRQAQTVYFIGAGVGILTAIILFVARRKMAA